MLTADNDHSPELIVDVLVNRAVECMGELANEVALKGDIDMVEVGTMVDRQIMNENYHKPHKMYPLTNKIESNK